MSKQRTLTFNSSAQSDEKPLSLDQQLILIKLANERGYSVKAAREMKSLYDVVSSELYAVWYALENELPIFADNISELMKFTGWDFNQSSLVEDFLELDLAKVS